MTVRVLVAVLSQVSVWDNAVLLSALLLLRERARIRSTVPRGQQEECRPMRLHIENHGHDPRQVDLVAVIALIILVFVAICYLSGPTNEQMATALIVPSQTVHW